MQTIAERLDIAHNAIKLAAKAAHRDYHSVQLLAVSKTKPVSDIHLAYKAGQRMFGENYVQEGVEKILHCQSLSGMEWHMIGPIQSNKTKLVAEHFDWVQSVDREKIARRLDAQRPESLPPLNICIQINIDDESSKSGVGLDQADTLMAAVESLPRLTLRGIMAIPKANASDEERAHSFARLQQLFSHAQERFPQVDTLSLGMSNDMTTAIQYGSTMVRLGTALFGSRDKKG
ncbi:YggS family pyridoxal phosphate-dependent enzyme [Alteromonas sediminis]|uniref:Pyridoxal phosphate homeostasis protein n=1 Tax=Alteromonas sediminis TaxID=2259342 RepID=A0A3N5Y4S8_9ALTE|nr:YggS family pyridoxal phosphate-dependent enzyme [Alteromonas sediminis]RPJ67916.1 YggS family pyridoxal phosphate-dependent enzyme [Alteromonas sediminis]